jgi:SHS2 domain-containing protein
VNPGHRLVPHTADIALEAWAPIKYECVAPAVYALVDSFTELPDDAPRDSVILAVDPTSDEDFPVSVLDEVIYQMEVHGRVPADVSIDENTNAVRLATVPTDEVRIVGALPKAVSLHELRFTQVGGAWQCHVTVDV